MSKRDVTLFNSESNTSSLAVILGGSECSLIISPFSLSLSLLLYSSYLVVFVQELMHQRIEDDVVVAAAAAAAVVV